MGSKSRSMEANQSLIKIKRGSELLNYSKNYHILPPPKNSLPHDYFMYAFKIN